MAFSRSELREALGEAYTDDIAGKLITMHRSVVDPIKDDLDAAKRDATKWKAEADKLPGVQKELDELKKGEDWKAKYDQEKKAHDDYKAQVAREAEVAKIKAAYKKLLTEEKISDKAIETALSKTDYSGMKLKEDGTLDKVDDLKKNIQNDWGFAKVEQRKQGEKVATPPVGAPTGSDSAVRTLTAKWHAQRFGAPAQTGQPQNQ